jgi:hypothetical protein
MTSKATLSHTHSQVCHASRAQHGTAQTLDKHRCRIEKRKRNAGRKRKACALWMTSIHPHQPLATTTRTSHIYTRKYAVGTAHLDRRFLKSHQKKSLPALQITLGADGKDHNACTPTRWNGRWQSSRRFLGAAENGEKEGLRNGREVDRFANNLSSLSP